jgi:5-methylcytosine-specific restriction protein A
VDHIEPFKFVGSNDRANLQRLCHACHSRKTLRENR